MDEIEIIKKWNINKSFIAREMNMIKGTFHNKIMNKRTSFNEKEKILLRSILKKMAKDIMNILPKDK